MRSTKIYSYKTNHSVTFAEVLDFTDLFQQHYSEKQQQPQLILNDSMRKLLANEKATGIRYYYGIDELGKECLIFTAVNERGNDLLENNELIQAIHFEENAHLLSENDHAISAEIAAHRTADFRKKRTTRQPKGGYFSRNAVEKVVNQDGSIALVAYFGADQNGTRVLCIGGVSEKNEVLKFGNWIEMSDSCPPFCSEINYLNSSKYHKVFS